MSMFTVQRQLVGALIARIAADPAISELIGDDPQSHRLFCTGATTAPHVFPAGAEGLAHRGELTLTVPGERTALFLATIGERIAELIDDADIPLEAGVLIECSLKRAAIETVTNPHLPFVRVSFEALTVDD